MEIKGINTAPITQNERLFLMAFKIRDNNDNERLLFLQLTTLIDFLIILRGSVQRVAQRLVAHGDDYKAKCMVANEALAKNIPQVTQVDVMQPDPGNLVMSMAPKMREDGFSLIAVLHNESVVSLKIDDTQAEMVILAISQAIDAIDDKETQLIIGNFLEFLILYEVDLFDIKRFQYNALTHEPWKQHFFAEYLAILYSFETEKGKQLLEGVIIKTNVEPHSQAADNMLQNIAKLMPRIKSLQEKYPLSQTFCRVIPSTKVQALTQEECLRALHSFCLETQASLTQ